MLTILLSIFKNKVIKTLGQLEQMSVSIKLETTKWLHSTPKKIYLNK